MKVAVLGAAGGIGQALALLLKLQLPAGTELSLYDIAPVTPGVAKDVSHIPTAVKAEGFSGEDPTPGPCGRARHGRGAHGSHPLWVRVRVRGRCVDVSRAGPRRSGGLGPTRTPPACSGAGEVASDCAAGGDLMEPGPASAGWSCQGACASRGTARGAAVEPGQKKPGMISSAVSANTFSWADR